MITIVYTSDVHGQCTSTDYATDRPASGGLTRLSTYLKQHSGDVLYVDNGDFLQGSPLLDYARENPMPDTDPMSVCFNHLHLRYMTVGNHDFNYGLDYLQTVLSRIDANVLCCNIRKSDGSNLFEPHAIHVAKDGHRIGLIGAITNYVPKWEKPEHIEGLTFEDARDAIAKEVALLRPLVDVIVVLYHGGFEADLATGNPVGRQTDENQGYRISQIPDIDLLLTGHQHVPTVVANGTPKIMQTSFSARDVGVATLDFTKASPVVDCHLHRLTEDDDEELVQKLLPFELGTRQLLDQYLAITDQDWTIEGALGCRIQKHPLFQLINQVQREHTGAQLSCASLPNHPPGFQKRITRRDVAANFVYPNTVFVLEVTGAILRQALERTAEYFEKTNGNIVISEAFTTPKMEHYNYDVYDGIDYEIDVSKPKGQRIVSLKHNGNEVQDKDVFSLAMNNYRAAGGGDYAMFEAAIVLAEYDNPLSEWIVEAVQRHPELHIDVVHNFNVF